MAYKIPSKREKSLKSDNSVPKTINTANGTAYFVRTDIENENGKWRGMDLTIREGFWIIHKGKYHHIYQN